ncbi:MAG: hypothetical protein WC635_01585 [Bacteriovorax sp.]
MITYETYKLIHLFCIMMFFSSLGFVACSSEFLLKKAGKLVIGIASFLILAAGMGLIARLGFKHGDGFPLWLNLKIAAWFFINILFIALFKLKNFKQKVFVTLFILLTGWAAVWVVLNKPI